jgi:hypothetical protein
MSADQIQKQKMKQKNKLEMVQLAEALRYKSEGRGFHPR